MEPFHSWPSKFSLEYLLLPARSARQPLRRGLTCLRRTTEESSLKIENDYSNNKQKQTLISLGRLYGLYGSHDKNRERLVLPNKKNNGMHSPQIS